MKDRLKLIVIIFIILSLGSFWIYAIVKHEEQRQANSEKLSEELVSIYDDIPQEEHVLASNGKRYKVIHIKHGNKTYKCFSGHSRMACVEDD